MRREANFIFLLYLNDFHGLALHVISLHIWAFQMDLRNIPEEVVKETLEYKCLQSQFSLLYNESLGVKTQLDEARALLLTAKNAHLRQIEHMEVTLRAFLCVFVSTLMIQRKDETPEQLLQPKLAVHCSIFFTV